MISGNQYTNQLITNMLGELTKGKTRMGKDFLLEFDVKEPGRSLKDEKGNTGIKVSSDELSDFMEKQDKKGMVSRMGAIAMLSFSFFDECDSSNVVRMLKYMKSELSPHRLEEYEEAVRNSEYPSEKRLPGQKGSVTAKLCNIAIWEAINGNAKVRESLLRLYKKGYRKEYNTMKKFSKMDFYDVMEVIRDEEKEEEEAFRLSRLLFFAELKGIEIEKPALFYEVLNWSWNGVTDDFYATALPPLDEDYVISYEDEETAAEILEDAETINRVSEIYDTILSNSEIDGSYSIIANGWQGVNRLMEIAPFYNAAMDKMTFWPDDTEKTFGLIFAYVVDHAKEFYRKKMKECEQLLGLAKIEGEDFLKDIWEEPSAQKETPAQASAARLALSNEVEELKNQLVRKEAELQKATDQIQALKKSVLAEEREKESIRKQLETIKRSENAILPVDDLSQDDENEKPAPLTTEEKIEFLKNKRICLVGGHQNWIYKIKDLFPEWTYIKNKATSATSDGVLDAADHVYFFTDTMSHVSYVRFVTIARNKGIPCSYLHSINLERVIDELYAEYVKKEGK